MTSATPPSLAKGTASVATTAMRNPVLAVSSAIHHPHFPPRHRAASRRASAIRICAAPRRRSPVGSRTLHTSAYALSGERRRRDQAAEQRRARDDGRDLDVFTRAVVEP